MDIKTFSGDSKAVFVTADECKDLCSAVGLVYHEGLEKRIVAHTITDESTDRSGDVVVAKGVDTSNFYPKNPIVMAFHDYHNLPVGTCVKIWHDAINNSVRAYTLFYDNKIDPTGKSDTIFKMVNAGALKGVSIGFKCNTSRRPKDEDERIKLKLGEYGRLIESCELVEYSIVPIPDNGNALTLSSIEGIDKKELELVQKSIEKYMNKNIEYKTDTIKKDIVEDLKSVISGLVEKINNLELTISDLSCEIKELNKNDVEFNNVSKQYVDADEKEAIQKLNRLFTF